MGRAAEAGTRYLSSVEKAMRRMSDKSSIESRNALSDAKREAETSLSLVVDSNVDFPQIVIEKGATKRGIQR